VLEAAGTDSQSSIEMRKTVRCICIWSVVCSKNVQLFRKMTSHVFLLHQKSGPQKIRIEVSYQRAQNLGVAKWQFSGNWMRHLCQKVPIWGVYGAFRSAISSALPWRQKFKILGLGDQNSGVWYNTFRLQRPQIRGFASYIWAPKPKFLGVTV